MARLYGLEKEPSIKASGGSSGGAEGGLNLLPSSLWASEGQGASEPASGLLPSPKRSMPSAMGHAGCHPLAPEMMHLAPSIALSVPMGGMGDSPSTSVLYGELPPLTPHLTTP